jgi:hypothetical protein
MDVVLTAGGLYSPDELPYVFFSLKKGCYAGVPSTRY